MCGFLGFIEMHVDGMRVIKTTVRSAEVTLPHSDSKMFKCAVAMGARWPTPIRTAEVAEIAGLERGETSSLLVALMSQGLVTKVEERKGREGGSTWKLTYIAEKLLNKGVA